MEIEDAVFSQRVVPSNFTVENVYTNRPAPKRLLGAVADESVNMQDVVGLASRILRAQL